MSESIQHTEMSLTHVQSAYQKIVKRMQRAHDNSEPLDQLERDLVTEVMNLGHACLQDFIDAAGDGDSGEQMTTGGQVIGRSRQKHRCVYRSVFGDFEIEQRAHDELGIPLPRRPTPQKDYPKSKYCHVLGDRKTQRAIAGAFYSIETNVRTVQDVLQGQSQVPISNKRLWAEMNLIGQDEVSRGVQRVFESLAAERTQRDPQGKKTLVCLMDGDRHLWSLQQEYFPDAIAVLDLFHVMEYLWLASHCFHRESSLEAERWVGRHLNMLLENKVDCVRGLLQRAINGKSLNKTKLEHLAKVYRYFSTNRERMQYGDYLAAGYPIGSGVIEGACKHVIGDRMCGTGMRWEAEGAQPMLDLRVTKLNGEWDDFISYRIRAEQDLLYNIAV